MAPSQSFTTFVRKHHKLLFFGTWLLINLVQAGMTELFDDEAYYWVYSRFPSWGYFDHPPMVALMIRAGYFLFRNEFGLRLFIVLSSTATLYIIGELITRKNDRLFYAIACSMAVMQIGGILAVPDIPLLFFSALFFLAYKNFVRQTTIRNAVFLGIVIALLFYSKYHGVLIVLFTLLSYPRLLLKYQAWLAAAIAFVLFFPHLYWQWANGFPSLQYHLMERVSPHYQWDYTTEYLAGQLLLAGPFAGFILIWASLAYRPADRLERALKYTVCGFYIFFLLSTAKGRVEANWTIPIFIGLAVLSHQYLLDREKLARWIYRLAPLTVLIVMAGRTYMILDIGKSGVIQKDEFHGNRKWVERIREQSKGLPLVFIDSYQRASKYWFYSGIPALSYNSTFYRRSNYNFWPLEDSLIGKRVYVVGTNKIPLLDEKIDLPGWEWAGAKTVDHYYSFTRVRVSAGKEVLTPANYLPYFQRPEFGGMEMQAAIFREDVLVGFQPTGVFLRDIRTVRSPLVPFVPKGLAPGDYHLRYTLGSCIPGMPSLNSPNEPLAITK